VRAGPRLRPDPAAAEADVEAAQAAVRCAVGRLRTLLIELNSYLSGGLPWALGDAADARLVQRGLAIYRFPAAAAVDVTGGTDCVRREPAPTKARLPPAPRRLAAAARCASTRSAPRRCCCCLGWARC
jgi:hypothetical protein